MPTSPRNQPINQWAEDDRPREKMLLKGKSALSNAELIALLIGSGNVEESAVQLAQRMLDATGNNLIEFSKLSIEELSPLSRNGQSQSHQHYCSHGTGQAPHSRKGVAANQN